MNILIVSATQFEVKPLLDFLEIENAIIGLNKAIKPTLSNTVTVLITGVGMVNTAYMMGKYNKSSYDLVINAGVCGAFTENLELGEIVNVTEDILSEMGAEDGDEFLTYDKLNLSGKHIYLGNNKASYLMVDLLKNVKGITVNTIHGNEISIEKVKKRYKPDIESMEGAAFFAACDNNINDFLQIRTISNYVEKRDKSKWQMPLAIQNLNDFLITFIDNV